MTDHVVGVNDSGLRVGEHHHRAKLTDREVGHLLELREQGWSYGRLAEKFEISKSQARHICKGSQRCQLAVGFRTVHIPG